MGDFLGALIADVLGVRKKRSRGVTRFLTRGAGSFVNTSVLLGGAGIAWSLFEELLAKSRRPESTTSVESSTMAPSLSTVQVQGPEPAESRELPGLALAVTRLLVSAARADGELSEEELAFLVEHARERGVEERMRAEWQSPRPLGEIAAGLQAEAHRRDAYTLVYSILRADEDVNGAEQIFLAQLAHALRLDPQTTAALERDAARRIDIDARSQGGAQ